MKTGARREKCDGEEREANGGGDGEGEEREAPPRKEREAR